MAAPHTDIRLLAGSIEAGFDLFIHRTTGEIIEIPHNVDDNSDQIEFWEEPLKLVQENPSSYIRIEPQESFFAFKLKFRVSIGHTIRLRADTRRVQRRVTHGKLRICSH